MIVATAFLASGIYMFGWIYDWHMAGWFHAKLTLVVAGLVLGIIGFKKRNKLLASASMFMFVYIILLAFTKNMALFA